MSTAVLSTIAGGVAGLAVWLIAVGLVRNTGVRRRNRLHALLTHAFNPHRHDFPTAESLLVAEIAAKPFHQRILKPQWRRLTRLALKYAPARIIVTFQRQLDAAGNPGKLAPHEFLVAKVVTMSVGAGLGAASVSVWFVGGLLRPLLYVVACAVAGFMAPDLWVYRRRRKHLEGIRKAMPDVVDLIRVSMEGGLSYDGAVNYAVAKVKNPFTYELGRYLIDRQIGRGTDEAMHAMGNRTREPDLMRLVEVVVQGEALGTGINRALNAFSRDLRIKRRQHAEKRAHQATTKMLFPMILLILPAVFIIILGPTIPVVTKSLGL